MTKLNYHQSSISWLEIQPANYNFSQMKEFEKWSEFKRQYLFDVAKNKDCFLITASPQQWSITQEFPDNICFSVNKQLYEAVFFNTLSEKIIDEIVACPDFDLGNLWIVFWNNQDAGRFRLLIEEQQKRGMRPPCTQESLIMCETDGNILYWMNPSISPSEVTTYIQRLSRSLGWDL